MIVELDAASPLPPYAQLRRQIAGAIVAGAVRAGEQLPTVRQLSRDLGVAAGTVQRAYRELEDEGLVEAQGRRGRIVLPRDRWATPDDVEASLREGAARFAGEVRRLGVDDAAAIAALRSALQG